LSKGGDFSPPFGLFILPEAGKGRWGGILKSLFQTAKLLPSFYVILFKTIFWGKMA